MVRTPLNPDQIEEALAALPGWEWSENKLKKGFTLGNFREAVSFIVRLSFEAEALNHHPELYNVYNKVRVEVTTHDAGNLVTDMDVQLARAIEAFSWV